LDAGGEEERHHRERNQHVAGDVLHDDVSQSWVALDKGGEKNKVRD
jgi:hypothetical protein